ncbi:MAG: molybdenum cofactor guanylyltransferase [Flavobacteriales bacterium]|nr:molybdenum cofactor guanylyltransferase [Flavobacteriales bacterium]
MKATLIILAGGKSSRMGFDKGLILHKGKHITQYLIDVNASLFSKVLISSNNKEYRRFKESVIPDTIIEIGPIGGIVSCLEKSTTDLNVFISCDAPFINKETLKKLLLKSIDSNADIVYSKHGNRTHPFPSCFNKRIFNKLNRLILSGERKMSSLSEFFKTDYVDFNNEKKDFFLNLNNPDDLKKIS